MTKEYDKDLASYIANWLVQINHDKLTAKAANDADTQKFCEDKINDFNMAMLKQGHYEQVMQNLIEIKESLPAEDTSKAVSVSEAMASLRGVMIEDKAEQLVSLTGIQEEAYNQQDKETFNQVGTEIVEMCTELHEEGLADEVFDNLAKKSDEKQSLEDEHLAENETPFCNSLETAKVYLALTQNANQPAETAQEQ